MTAIEVVCQIAKRNRNIREIMFAAYYYVPQSLTDRGLLKLYRLKEPTAEKIERFVEFLGKKLKKGWTFGVTSRVKLKSGGIRHIPQIDFACLQSPHNFRRSLGCLRHFVKAKPGYLLKSGRSYHYYGLSLLTERQWQIFIGNCLLCNAVGKKSVVDARWFAYSMRRGFSNLRIVASDGKPEPMVITKV